MAQEIGKPIAENPFYVLALATTCARAEVEREGLRWIALLELGDAAAATYRTPLGPRPRSTELVRWAMAELRDPDRRLKHEAWAQIPLGPADAPRTSSSTPRSDREPWAEAFRALGWTNS